MKHTYIKTKTSDLAVTLEEIKLHLRIDNTVAGTKAAITKGTSNSQIVITAKNDGTYGNSYTFETVESGNNTTLAVALTGTSLVVTLETDGSGNSVSTVNDVIAKLAGVTDINNQLTITSGAGDGTGILVEYAAASFTGGTNGQADDDDYIESLILAAQEQAESILRKKITTKTLVAVWDDFPGDCLELDFGPVESIISIKYLDSDNIERTISTSDYYESFTETPAKVFIKPDKSWPSGVSERENAVYVEYETGYQGVGGVPEGIKMALKQIVGHYYSNREWVAVGPGIGALEVPQTATWLLWPYRDLRY